MSNENSFSRKHWRALYLEETAGGIDRIQDRTSNTPEKVYLYPMEEARADGDFYLHTPQSTLGSYSITFSCPGYDDYSETFSTKNHISDVVILLEQSGAPSHRLSVFRKCMFESL